MGKFSIPKRILPPHRQAVVSAAYAAYDITPGGQVVPITIYVVSERDGMASFVAVDGLEKPYSPLDVVIINNYSRLVKIGCVETDGQIPSKNSSQEDLFGSATRLPR